MLTSIPGIAGGDDAAIIIGCIATLLAWVALLLTVLIPFAGRIWSYLTKITDQMIKQIYKWVSNIRNNLQSLLKKMGIKWSEKKEEFPENKFQEWKKKISGVMKDARENFKKRGFWDDLKEIYNDTIVKHYQKKMGLDPEKLGTEDEVRLKTAGDTEWIKKWKVEVIEEGVGEEIGDKSISETSAEEDSVINKIDRLLLLVEKIDESLETKDEKAPTEDSLTEIKEALMRIEGALGLSDITAALEEIRAGLQAIVGPVGEGEEVAATGENPAITEAKPAENEVKLEEKIDDLGVDVRDSKRSLQFDINEVKAKLDRLIKVIEEKAMTFNDIYDKLCLRMIREHRNATGRTLR